MSRFSRLASKFQSNFALTAFPIGLYCIYVLNSTVHSDGELVKRQKMTMGTVGWTPSVSKQPKLTNVTPKQPVFTRGEVSKHNSKDKGIWVTYQNAVYDITSFVDIHPGGEKILLAAGQAIDPFWAVFSIHGSAETKALLEGYRIGDLMPQDEDPTYKDHKEPLGLAQMFANEPVRHPSLIVRSSRPCNAEAPPDALLKYRVTPNELHFVRNHLPVPNIDPESFKLEIEGPGVDDISLDLETLKKLPKTSVEVTLQCAGNRRNEMHQVRPVKGLLWTGGAISNAVWTGVRLRDVLEHVGVKLPDPTADHYPEEMAHVCFSGAEGYGASIPIEKALDPRGDVLLAYEMNGEPIPRDHGYPLRAVVPGHVAARSVKWVSKIALSEDESQSHWQQQDYKGFNPSRTLENSDYSQSESIQELPVQSAVLDPQPGQTVRPLNGKLNVRGYAIAGGGRAINRVDVSVDGGKTWTDAQLMKPNQPRDKSWAWTQWEAQVSVPRDTTELDIVCKAVDSSYNTQPDTFNGIYNARGVLNSAWQHIKTSIDKF
ncbi:Oxidoreductase, molybdopterin-binding domain-containing protein [Gorgonomyces haynaldii]|nr:Oxidoreductase, molybdopterin-binding domain-containing protein [Gorgonomyces haynaldii]